MRDPGASERVFCAPWFRPLIVVTTLVIVGAVGWTVHDLVVAPPRPAAAPAGTTPVATAPPIVAGQPAPHKDFGHCTRCHDVRSAGGGTGAMPVATAPPIARGAKLTHPDWGPCGKCHQYTGPAAATAAPVAFTRLSPTAGSLLGLRVDALTPKQADLLEMEGVKGPLVTEVVAGSPAALAGLKVEDAILKINDVAVKSAADVRQALRAVKGGGKVKLQIQRGERKKNVFVRMPDLGAAPDATLVAAVTAPAPTRGAALVPGRIAIAVTAPDLRAQVAPVFSGAAYFLVRDGDRDWVALQSPSVTALGRGQASAGLLLGQGVSVVIAGNVGPGAFETLRRGGVTIYTGAFGAVARVYESYRAGALVPAATTVVAAPPAPSARGIVAVGAMGPGLGFPVAASLGRSPYLVLYDVATGRAQALPNPGEGREGGELGVVQLLVDRGAAAAIAGGISPAGLQALTQLNLMGFAGVTGTVGDAISLYGQGRLQASTVGALAAPVAPGPALRPRG
ncbi:MAG TPA: NifB/NifX family molybdenum-iron cluster-binding protein [Polyangia bacterium]|jgi:predicted Fe-Mo cluster-binding NifX family protein